MARRSAILAAVLAATLGALPAPARAATITIDHTTTDPSSIPQSALDAARALTSSFSHASVGENIWTGLGLLAADDASRYAFPNWSHNNRGNPAWQAKVDDFETYVAAHLASYQVFLNKFCYIDRYADFAYYRDSMVELQGLYPAKTFVWFTMPIEKWGVAERDAFNAAVRSYAAQHAVVLFDLADIESHQPDGTAVTEGGYEAMYAGYTTDGGHLITAGQRRMAGAWWHLMARIAGWNPSGGPVCGNGTCESGETYASCAADCAIPEPPPTPTPGGTSGGCASAGLGGGAGVLLLALLAAQRARRRGGWRG